MRGLGFSTAYGLGVTVQFFNMFETWYSFEKHLESKKGFPSSLVMPAGFLLLIGGSILWPISLPIMVVRDLRQNKD
jgi:hypothetical protein